MRNGSPGDVPANLNAARPLHSGSRPVRPSLLSRLLHPAIPWTRPRAPACPARNLALAALPALVCVAMLAIGGPPRLAAQAPQTDAAIPSAQPLPDAPAPDSSSKPASGTHPGPDAASQVLPRLEAASSTSAAASTTAIGRLPNVYPGAWPGAWPDAWPEPAAIVAAPRAGPYVPLDQCPYDQTHARECRVHIKPLVLSSLTFLTFMNAGNVYTGYWYRYETTTGKWWDRYVNSVEDWRWNRWSDNNPFLDDYVGHPMQGAITNSLWIQNDPQGMTLEQSNSWPYWRSRLRATALSTFYSFEWKLGPIGEASVGHNGDHFYSDGGTVTNETGWVELVSTPVGGLLWNLAEDALDKHVVRRLEDRSRNPLLLTAYNFLTPARGFANILRFRPPWYRDSRIVKASSFWTDPGEGMSATTQQAIKDARRDPRAQAYVDSLGAAAGITRPQPLATNWEGPGGKHEFGAVWGLSVMTGHVFGYASDVKYMPIELRYSYELYRHHQAWTLRYAPELTALAMIDWPTPMPIGKGQPGTVFNQRARAYGSGLSPVSFEMDFRPLSRVQPFFREEAGGIYFDQRVLNPHGSQFMYTIGPDVGLNIYRHQRQTVTIGWRYTHLSNANISLHNPGTDANVFYVGVSRFHSKGD